MRTYLDNCCYNRPYDDQESLRIYLETQAKLDGRQMTMAISAAELMDQGMRALVEELGHVRAERFVSLIIREKFDYTKWQRGLFDDMSVNELNRDAAKYAASQPW